MKKEDIDDRLMDALLRGKSDEDLVAGVAEASKVKKGNFVRTVLAIAAMVVFGAIGMSVFNQSQQKIEEGSLTTTSIDYEVLAKQRIAEQKLAELDAQIEEQKKKVENRRKVLDVVVREAGIPYFEGERIGSASREDQLTASFENNVSETGKTRNVYGNYLDKVRSLEGEALYIWAAGLPGDDNIVAQIYPEYLQTRVDIERFENESKEQNPSKIATKKEELQRLDEQLQEAVVDLQKKWFGESVAISMQLQMMENTSEQLERELVQNATKRHDYKEAAREYEKALAVLQSLKLKHLAERVSSSGDETDSVKFAEKKAITRPFVYTERLATNSEDNKEGFLKMEGLQKELQRLDSELEELEETLFSSSQGQGSSDSKGVQEEISEMKIAKNEERIGGESGSVAQELRVMGSVQAPGRFSTRPEMTLQDALEDAGGPSTFGTTKRVSILREGKKYALNPLTNAKHRAELVYPGDVIEVDQVKAWESGGCGGGGRLTASSVAPQSEADFGTGWGNGGGGGDAFFGRQESLGGRTRGGRRIALAKSSSFSTEAENYGKLVDQSWKNPRKEALSTFSVDVDTASYTNIRRLLNSGSAIPKDAVRIEELVNYFDYSYPQPEKGEAFGVGLAMASCPWEPKHHLVRVALQGKEVKAEERGDANLVFLVDVSGSMQDSDKLPLLVESLGLMVEELREKDSVAIVVYAGREGLVLEPTEMGQGGREVVVAALGKLSAGGSTNGGAGIELAYRLAKKNFVKGGINRVILATDGDFNVGLTGKDALVSLVKKEAEDGVFLSVCGFGRGNLNDAMLEAITNEGNGVYYYIDSIAEGRRVFLEKLMGTLVTIAKDVKIQVEFNPAKVGQYRLIGYANRILKKEDFNNDKVDAGDIGSGHQVTAFYEIIPAGVTDTVRPEVDDLKYQEQADEPNIGNDSPDWMTVKLRHKKPDGEKSVLNKFVLQGEAKPWTEMDADYRFAAGVALWGMGMRGTDDLEKESLLAKGILSGAAGKMDARIELVDLLKVKDVVGGRPVPSLQSN